MGFATQRAADAAFILSRSDSEFGCSVVFWDSDEDPLVDAGSDPIRGMRLVRPSDRKETGEGQSTVTRVTVQVTKASVASIDAEGFVAVNGEVFAIESVRGDDDVSWVIVGARESMSELGDGERFYR